MSNGVGIRLGADEMPANEGDICHCCKEPIVGVKLMPYLQVMAPEEVSYFNPWCKECWEKSE